MHGLGEEVVCPGFETLDTVFDITQRGHKDDWNQAGARIVLEPTTDSKTIRLWHHHIEKDEIWPLAVHLLERFRSIPGFDHLVAAAEQQYLQDPDIISLVIYNEDFACSSSMRGSTCNVSGGSKGRGPTVAGDSSSTGGNKTSGGRAAARGTGASIVGHGFTSSSSGMAHTTEACGATLISDVAPGPASARSSTVATKRYRSPAVSGYNPGCEIITERTPHRAHGTLQYRVTDELVWPDVLGKLLLSDHPVTMQ